MAAADYPHLSNSLYAVNNKLFNKKCKGQPDLQLMFSTIHLEENTETHCPKATHKYRLFIQKVINTL